MSIKHIITYEMINEKRTILIEKIGIYGITCIWQFYKVKEPQGLSYVDLVYIVRYQRDNCMIILKDLLKWMGRGDIGHDRKQSINIP